MPTPPTTKGRKIYKVNTASQALLIKLMLDDLENGKFETVEPVTPTNFVGYATGIEPNSGS